MLIIKSRWLPMLHLIHFLRIDCITYARMWRLYEWIRCRVICRQSFNYFKCLIYIVNIVCYKCLHFQRYSIVNCVLDKNRYRYVFLCMNKSWEFYDVLNLIIYINAFKTFKFVLYYLNRNSIMQSIMSVKMFNLLLTCSFDVIISVIWNCLRL